MSGPVAALVGVIVALTAVAAAVLVLVIALTVGFDLRKLRPGRQTPRSLDELVGQERFARLLPATVPRGPVDQLNTPELREAARRKVE